MSSADSGDMFCPAVFDLQPNLAGRMHGGMEVVVGGLLVLSANGVSGALARVSFDFQGGFRVVKNPRD